MRLVVAALLVAALAAGCDDNGQKYSRSDVERAFRSQEFELVAPNRHFVFKKEAMLALIDRQADDPPTARTGQPILVLIYEDEKGASDAYRTLRSQASFESFDARNENVVVHSDEGVTAPMRKRIRAALAELSLTRRSAWPNPGRNVFVTALGAMRRSSHREGATPVTIRLRGP